jgi:nicotinamidase-related amidase
MKKALLLVDVQKHYIVKRHNANIDYINRLIGKYSKNKLPIFNLVYCDPFGRTMVESVRKKLEKASGVWHFNKLQTDGSKEASAILSMRGFEPGNAKIHVCGFYTDLCVMYTVKGLAKAGHKIVVHDAGTGASHRDAQNSSIKRMKKLGIEILHEDDTVG